MPEKIEKKDEKKTPHPYGTWIHKKTISKIVVCECSNKYIKTRAGQLKCLRCLSRNK